MRQRGEALEKGETIFGGEEGLPAVFQQRFGRDPEGVSQGRVDKLAEARRIPQPQRTGGELEGFQMRLRLGGGWDHVKPRTGG